MRDSVAPLDGQAAQKAEDPVAITLLGHDLRAAVSDIIGGLRLIDQTPMNEATRLQLERVRAASEDLARLLEEGLSVMMGDNERYEAHPSIIHLARLMHDIEMRWSGRALEKGLGFSVRLAEDLPPALTLERIGLERVLSNLLSNAIKYTDRGAVRLTLDQAPDKSLRIVVRDDGPGFSDEALARLFQYKGRPSGTEKPGSGLGLHIAKEMADRLGGTLKVVNRAEGGAEVALSLPASVWLASPPLEHTVLPDLTQLRVLLAEDSLTNQQIIGGMLNRLGATCVVAGDGVEAIERLENESFDLLLVDIEMPRLSGIDVIKGLRAMNDGRARMPVLAVTAYVLRANREAIYSAGADGILSKPVLGIEAFGMAIASVLERARGDQPVILEADEGKPLQLLDMDRFERLMDIAGPEGNKELLTRLYADLQQVERGILRGLAEPDWSEIRAQTHVLISLAGAVGADRLHRAAQELNIAAHRHDGADLSEQGQDVLNLLDKLIFFVSRQGAVTRVPL